MDLRPSRDECLVATAFVWAKRSTCSRLQVGAVFHRQGRVLVQGYNGAPAGMPHCNHECNCAYIASEIHGDEHWHNCASVQPCNVAVHAEQNGIAWAARHGVALNESDLVVTHQPCLSCAKSIINAGVKSVTYVREYRLTDGVDLLRSAGIRVEQYLDWDEPRMIGSLGEVD